MDPDHHRQRPLAPADGSPHVEVEAVFARFGTQRHPGEHRQAGRRVFAERPCRTRSIPALPARHAPFAEGASATRQRAARHRGFRGRAERRPPGPTINPRTSPVSTRTGSEQTLRTPIGLGVSEGAGSAAAITSAGIHDKIRADPSAVMKRLRASAKYSRARSPTAPTSDRSTTGQRKRLK